MPDSPNPDGAVQPENPFALLGLPPVYTIDEAALQRAWLKRSAKLHPDRAGNDADAARRLALINTAKATLEHPERRANALLEAMGGPSKEDDNALPDGLLMEMFEIREKHESGDAQTRATIEAWGSERRAKHERTIAEMFAGLGDPPAQDALHAIRKELNAWRYIERFLSEPGLD